MDFKTGPFVKVACFCDTVIEEKDGVYTFVRIIDVITHHPRLPDMPDEMPPFIYPLKMVIMLGAGMARGRHRLEVVLEYPNGLRESGDSLLVTVHFEEGRTATVVADLAFEFEQEGTYLFHVVLEDEHLTSIPVTIRYAPIKTSR